MTDAAHPEPKATIPDAICAGLRQATALLPVAATITYTLRGLTSLRASRERPPTPILSMSTRVETARRLTLAWGVYSVQVREVSDVDEMAAYACETAVKEGFAKQGDIVAITAGTPFGVSGSTNMLKIMHV
jgi:pyruvate kinase